MSLSRKHSASRESRAPRVDINIVPLVDVSLVLLIIFMVTATFIKSTAMKLDLPAASASPAPTSAKTDIVVEIDRIGRLAVNGSPVAEPALSGVLGDLAARNGIGCRVTVRGDSQASYGQIVHVMSVARDAGLTHLLVATKPDGGRVNGK